jgi:hypothetical protein
MIGLGVALIRQGKEDPGGEMIGDQGSMFWSQFFCGFYLFSAKILAFYWKTNAMIKILHNFALFWVEIANFYAEFFGENIFKIITSVLESDS